MATGENNNLGVKVYELQFREMLTAIYGNQAYFRNFFGGNIEAIDGVKDNENAFYVKTSDIPVVVGEYSTDPEVAFNSGTANSTRFGERTEIIYETTPVPYSWTWAIHEGIDRFTVNNNFDESVADRLEIQAREKVNLFNRHQGKFIADNAGKVLPLADYADDTVTQLFNDLNVYYTNLEVIGTKIANVTPELYNVIVDHKLAVREKGSTVNIDKNEVLMFKDFVIEALPEAQFQDGDAVYAYVQNVAKAFTGISTTRTFESEDFDGVALQGAGRAGQFIPEDNKKAVVKVTAPIGE